MYAGEELIHKPFQLYGLGELSKPGLRQTVCQHSLVVEMVSNRLCVSIALWLKWLKASISACPFHTQHAISYYSKQVGYICQPVSTHHL